MNKKFTKLMAALALLLFLFPITGWGQTTNFTLSSADQVTQDGITVAFAKGSGSNAPAWYAAGLRLYANNTVTISCENTTTITGVTFNWEKQGSKTFASVTANCGSYSHPSTTGTGTWSGSASSIVFTLGNSGQLQLNTFSVTYTTSGGGPTQLTAPTNFQATAGNGQAEFTWNAVSNASSYTISYTPQGGSELTATGITGTSTTITSLSNGTEYTCKIMAVGNGTSYSNSEYSSEITVTPTNTLYTVTLHAGTGTVNGEATFEWNNSMNEGNLPDAEAPCPTWSFGGWSTSAVSTQTTSAPTYVPTAYVPTSDITLYAVYTKTESGGSAFDGTTGGDFMIYAAVGETNYYATGTGSKINSTTTASEATTYTFEKPSGGNYEDGEFAIYTMVNNTKTYITYVSSTNLGTSANPYKWTITSGTLGTWRLTSETSGRGFIYRAGTTNKFGGYSTGNVTSTGEYYDLEIGGGTTTYYWSSPDCMETVATPTFDVNEGTYYEPQIIIIECETADASIYYTLNGEEPTSTESVTNFLYDENEGVEISSTTTLKAKAFKTGMNPSATRTATYTIIHNVAEPTLAESQLFTTDTYSVAITVPANTTVYYTTDGTAPTNASTQYTAAFNINATTTVKAIAYDTDGCASDVVTATFTRAYTLAGAKALYSGSAVSDVVIDLTGVQFIAKHVGNHTYTYVQQGTTGLLLYGANTNNWTNGDMFTAGTVTGTITKFGQNMEMTNFTFASVATEAGTLTASATNVGITNITGSFSTYEDRYVSLTSLEMDLDNLELSDGTNTLAIYDQFSVLGSATQPDDDVVVTGIVTSYTTNNTTTYQIVPIALTDITTGKAASLPTLTPPGGADAAHAVSTETVIVTPATSTTVTYTFGSSAYGEINAETEITVPSTEATELEVVASRDFYTDNSASYYYMSAAASYTVNFYENGELTYYEDNVVSGTSLAISSTTAPNGYVFMGWTTAAISGVQAGAPATLYNGSVTVDDNMDLYAVYAMEGEASVSYTKVDGYSSITEGTYLIAVNKVDSDNYNFANGQAASGHAGVEATGVATATSYTTSDIPEGALEYTLAGNNTNGFSIHCSNGYLNGGSAKFSLSYGNTATETWIFSDKDGGVVLTGASNGTKTSCNSTTAASAIRNYASTGAYYDPLYFFKKVETTTYGNYCTSVTILSGNISGTKTGANSIDATLGATIKTGTILTAAVLGNADPNVLEIEDGGQLITDSKGVQATVVKHIDQYTGTRDNYYLLASPIKGEIAATDVTDMLENTYDLYYFDADQETEEWQNYKVNTFAIANEKGYLYANSEDVDLEFSGELVPSNEGVTIPLTYTEENGPNFNGWNLVGNPFPCNATPTITDFYVISGTEVQATTYGTVAPCEAIFVKATADTRSVTFSKVTTAGNNSNLLNISLSKDGANMDKAFVRFGQGEGLPKFMLNADNTKISLDQSGVEYAVVYSEAEAELPVNFKASENGNYTLSVKPEDVDMNYLHLIDNMTGANVDLLATPSYTFEAKTTDYASRFRLVFSANEENGASTSSETFAFFNGSEWMISNTGNATLQVIDVLGRVLSSETISGTAMVSLKETAGVYMLRLVNGNDVKVQKVVVR